MTTIGCLPRSAAQVPRGAAQAPLHAAWLMATIGLLVLAAASVAHANNIRVSNVVLQGQNAGAQTVKVAFNLAWDNSWRGSENWDAAWVFVKFRAPGSNEWSHAKLSGVSANHTAPGATIDVGSDGANGMGVFVYRASGYTGSVNYTAARLQWNYGSNGYAFVKGDLVEVSVHALEMVYIPTGAFYLGSGGGEVSHFYKYDGTSQTTTSFLISSEDPITVGVISSGNLYYAYSTDSGDQTGIISNAFPKGYNAFYCMKYEVSQGQYADFLNKLTTTQWTNRQTTANYNVNRHSISGPITNVSAYAPDRACNYLSWADGIAYADWAALRPMTELEFEKACRGPANPVSNEYVWGTTTVMLDASRVLSGAENGTETVTNNAALGGCNYGNQAHTGGDGGKGPLRVGIFATNNATRISSGASYYGVMELSGNLWERPVTVGTNMGRAFMGTHGDGVLAADGNATNNADWPGTNAVGAGARGGDWSGVYTYTRVSDRLNGAWAVTTRMNHLGCRAVRTAP